jgi:hypothetical protein
MKNPKYQIGDIVIIHFNAPKIDTTFQTVIKSAVFEPRPISKWRYDMENVPQEFYANYFYEDQIGRKV